MKLCRLALRNARVHLLKILRTKSTKHVMTRRISCIVVVAISTGLATVIGCLPGGSETPDNSLLETKLDQETEDSLRDRIDAVLDYTLNERKLSLDQHAASHEVTSDAHHYF